MTRKRRSTRRRRYTHKNPFIRWIHKKFGWFINMSRKKQILIVIGAILGVLLITAILTTVIFASTLSSKESIMNRNKTGVTLLDRDGNVFYEFNNARSDTYVPLDQISETTRKALIAAEDKDFYKHPGFSITGIANAVFDNFGSGGNSGGGSTITQQLVKNALLSTNRNFFRKYQELILSIEIERQYSKEEILEMYLNSAYFGEGVFGIEDAAKAYFNKTAKDLDLAESSMLIGLLPAPSPYSPISGDPELAEIRQDYVLGRMQEDGYISEEEANNALKQELTYSDIKSDVNTKAPHFALMVKEELEEKYGEETIARSGYKVTTTLKLDWQDKAQSAVASQVESLSYSNVSNGSLIAVDPKSGEVLALVGSADWNNNEFGKVNMTTATRQPGSSFKPIVYATGIEQRQITAATIWEDKLTDFGGYTPYNYNKKFNGNVTTRFALANSLNIPAVAAMQTTGISNVIEQAESLGITTLTETPEYYGLPLALGSGQIRLSELTNAYAAFANGGTNYNLQTILKINDKNDKEIFKSKPKSKNAISSQTSFIISSMLSDNAARSTTFGSSLTLWGNRPAAVKTGTTEDYRDALTIGYTPSLAVGVWIGNNDNSPMSSIAGSSGSAPIWRQFMQEALANTAFEEFVQPSGIVSLQICYGSGAIATTSGTNTYSEFFRAGSIPEEYCEATPEKTEEEVIEEPKKEKVEEDKAETDTEEDTDPDATEEDTTPEEDTSTDEEPTEEDPEVIPPEPTP